MPSDFTTRRVYDPVECDEHGVPLDWDRCRACVGDGKRRDETTRPNNRCPICGGYGSLKAAALADKIGTRRFRFVDSYHCEVMEGSEPVENPVARCESCGHPMSEGTWDEPATAEKRDDEAEFRADVLLDVEHELREGRTGGGGLYVHYSPCDEGCRHGGPIRCDSPSELTTQWDTLLPDVDGDVVRAILAGGSVKVAASWRPVDVRTLGWAHDLRPEKLAVLCLRCYAERARGR